MHVKEIKKPHASHFKPTVVSPWQRDTNISMQSTYKYVSTLDHRQIINFGILLSPSHKIISDFSRKIRKLKWKIQSNTVGELDQWWQCWWLPPASSFCRQGWVRLHRLRPTFSSSSQSSWQPFSFLCLMPPINLIFIFFFDSRLKNTFILYLFLLLGLF